MTKLVSQLPLTATPLATDMLEIETALGVSERQTRALLNTLQTGESLTGENAAAPSIVDEAATATNPTLIPNKANLASGVGSSGVNEVSLICDGDEVLRCIPAALGVNFLQVSPGAAAGDPILTVEGTDTNIDLQINPKGTGGIGVGVSPTVFFHVNGAADDVFRFGHSGNIGAQDITTTATGGIYELRDGAGASQVIFDARSATIATIRVGNAAGPCLTNEAALATNPTLIPNQADVDTGIGWSAGNVANLVAGALECMEFASVSSAPAVGFYATAAIIKQTGVAVTPAAIHAALVNLGLIAA